MQSFNATGHYQISYSVMGGTTAYGILIIYACSENGTWKATRR